MLSFLGVKMRTIAYVDGYNLYHGRLKHTPFKWLDLHGLLGLILRIQSPASELVQIIQGRFTLSPERVPRYSLGRALNRDDRVDAWILGEKQTDVQLALHTYRDAAFGTCEQVLLCTNDSDLAPAVEFIKSDCPKATVGIVLPRPPELQARKSKTLQDLAHWTRDYILDEELAAHQLPARVQTGKKPADKPAHW